VESQIVLAPGSEILEAIGDAYQRFRDLAWQLKSRPEVKDTGFGMATGRGDQPHSLPFGMYVEATLWHDEPIVWSLDLAWFERWTIYASVTYGTGENISDLFRFEDRFAQQPETVPDLIRSAADELVATVDRIDFASLPPLPPEQWTAMQRYLRSQESR
jgi:hypothetical protein